MHKLLGATLMCGLLSGCAGMNSDFDCNKTATDQCLTTSEANKLAASGKSLDSLNAAKDVKKPAGETLPALRNTALPVNPARPVSVASTGYTSTSPIAPRPLATAPVSAATVARSAGVSSSIKPANDTGRVSAQRIPDATQRLWIAPWVDNEDNFHQPAVVEFVKNKSHWDEGFKVIEEGGE